MDINSIINTLLKNRNLDLTPQHPKDLLTPIDIKPALQLIKEHIAKNNKIFIYGDYDVDGVCATAILWETLYKDYKNVFPHIPHREAEGYGLSIKGIDHCLGQGAKLIIAVDNGIVAHEQVDYCRNNNCDIIIIDHHEPSLTWPEANVIIHSTETCAAGLAWYFSLSDAHLDLVALAVICDMIPLTGLNRSFAKFGLQKLNATNRPGLRALIEVSGIKDKIEAYHVGFILGPRLNAMGRLEHAIDSLRLLCTTDPQKAKDIAQILDQTNRERQDLTQRAVENALSSIELTNVLVSANHNYHPGIIGLIAAKLVEKHYRPAVVMAIGETESKGSARSIAGFHITEHLRTASHLLKNIGGHAMAAGFTLNNSKLEEFISIISNPNISADLLLKKQRVDMELPFEVLSLDLYTALQQLQPFGLGNPQPVFRTNNVKLLNSERLGKSNQHVKFQVDKIDAIWFNSPNDIPELGDIIYSLDQNTWNNQTKLQLLIKDIYV